MRNIWVCGKMLVLLRSKNTDTTITIKKWNNVRILDLPGGFSALRGLFVSAIFFVARP